MGLQKGTPYIPRYIPSTNSGPIHQNPLKEIRGHTKGLPSQKRAISRRILEAEFLYKDSEAGLLSLEGLRGGGLLL